MNRLLVPMRRAAGAAKRRLLPSAEVAAWRRACRMAERTPRYTRGEIALGPYTLQYSDLLSLCPQWDDIFVRGSLAFTTSEAAPRILDCGANLGLASLFFKRSYPAARITAFEADPSIAALLDRNLRVNGAADVEVVQAAVWTENGVVTFHADGADCGTLAAHALEPHEHSLRVPAVRLADRLAREPIDLLKLDIEGAELSVLADCETALGNVRAMLLEVHEFDPAERRSPDVLRLLERCGFSYAVTHVTPLPWREASRGAMAHFPGRSSVWIQAVSAWREARS
ncbi:MAG TPA: FkbM family methyltransferase [Vicinamibacterales bacterium]|nr:FkbM family methyltransferase [Vicinamibacterales bacterium]